MIGMSGPRERTWTSSEGVVNVDVLVTALSKLSFIFEVKESLTKDLIAEIIHPRHNDNTEQYEAVKKWVNYHADTALEHDEICQLISYVKLYQIEGADKTIVSPYSSSTVFRPPSMPSVIVLDYIDKHCRLICPYCSEIPSWTAEIRHQELVASTPEYCDDDSEIDANCTTRIEDIIDDHHELNDCLLMVSRDIFSTKNVLVM